MISDLSPMAGRARSLFHDQSLSIVLADLKEGQRLPMDKQRLALLVVIKGRFRLHGPDGSFVLGALGQWKLNPDEDWKIRALEDSTAALFIAEPTSRRAGIR